MKGGYEQSCTEQSEQDGAVAEQQEKIRAIGRYAIEGTERIAAENARNRKQVNKPDR